MRNQRSNLMLIVSLLGLALGVPLAFAGWRGLENMVAFFEEQGPRMLGGLVVVLSIVVFVRQIHARNVRASDDRAPSAKGQEPAVPASSQGESSTARP